jgi:hypothetical protein
MVFGVELGLANPKVVGAAALWRAIPKVAGYLGLAPFPSIMNGVLAPVLLRSSYFTNQIPRTVVSIKLRSRDAMCIKSPSLRQIVIA